MKLDTAIKEYMISLSSSQGMSDNTISNYARDLNKYRDYLKEKEIEDTNNIREDDIFSFIDLLNKKYAQATVSRIKTSIRNFHRFLNFKYDFKDPSLNITVSKGEKRLPIYATKSEIDRLMSVFDDEISQDLLDHTILETIYGLGLRVSECCNLKTNQINLTDGFVKILGKGNKERVIPIPDTTRRLMQQYASNLRGLWL